MTLHQVQLFTAAARVLNLTAAGKRFGISQPAVTRQMKLLEKECGVRLYTNTRRGIALTAAGRAFLYDAEEALLHFEKLKTFKFKGSSRSLTVGGNDNQSASFLPVLLAIFQKNNPRVQVTLRTDTSLKMEELIFDGKVEIAVITHPTNSAFLCYEPYNKEELAPIVSAEHPLASARELSLTQYLESPMINLRGGVSEAKIRELSKRGTKPNIVMNCESAEAVLAAVKKGMGVGLLLRWRIEADIKAGHVKIIKIPDFKIYVHSFIVYHKERPLSANALAFLSILRQSRLDSRRVAQQAEIATARRSMLAV